MNTIFVDTGAWFASVVASDPDHQAASTWLADNHVPLLTTDYVVDETLTLLRARGEQTKALQLGEAFFSSSLCEVRFLSETDLRLAWETFRRFNDKEWSFTDCASKVIIETLDITHALAFDHHFKQFGNVIIIP